MVEEKRCSALIGDTTRGGNTGIQSNRVGCDIRGSGDIDHWGSMVTKIAYIGIGSIACSRYRINSFEAEEIAGTCSQAGEIMRKRSQALGSQASVGRPARISGSAIRWCHNIEMAGRVASSSVVRQHITIHRNRSGGHKGGEAW